MVENGSLKVYGDRWNRWKLKKDRTKIQKLDLKDLIFLNPKNAYGHQNLFFCVPYRWKPFYFKKNNGNNGILGNTFHVKAFDFLDTYKSIIWSKKKQLTLWEYLGIFIFKNTCFWNYLEILKFDVARKGLKVWMFI